MKHSIKSVCAIIIAVLLLCMSLTAVAEPLPESAYIMASTVNAFDGSASVPVVIDNNPGVWSVCFTLEYDRSVLTLASVKVGDVFAEGDIVTSPLTNERFSFVAWGEANRGLITFNNNTKNGMLVMLNFFVNANAANGSYPISFYQQTDDDFINSACESISFTRINGAVVVSGQSETTSAAATTEPPTVEPTTGEQPTSTPTTDVQPTSTPTTGEQPTSALTTAAVVYGDVNGDKSVNAKDVLRLKQSLANWDVVIDRIASDVNVDDAVNAKDLLRLRQYLANWGVPLGAK